MLTPTPPHSLPARFYRRCGEIFAKQRLEGGEPQWDKIEEKVRNRQGAKAADVERSAAFSLSTDVS